MRSVAMRAPSTGRTGLRLHINLPTATAGNSGPAPPTDSGAYPDIDQDVRAISYPAEDKGVDSVRRTTGSHTYGRTPQRRNLWHRPPPHARRGCSAQLGCV